MEDSAKIISALGRFTVGDSGLANQISKSELTPREFFLYLITEKLKEATNPLEVSHWSDEFLLEIILGWLRKNKSIIQELNDSLTLENVQKELMAYVTKHNAELRAIVTGLNTPEMFRTIPSTLEAFGFLPISDALFRTSIATQFKDIGEIYRNYGIAASIIDRPNNLAFSNTISTLFNNMGSQLSDMQSLANNAALAQSPLFNATQILSKSALTTMTDYFGTVDLLAKQSTSLDQINRVIANQMPTIAASLRVAEMSALTQGAFASIDFNSIGSIIGLQKTSQQILATAFTDVLDTYSNHIMSLGLTEHNLSSIRPFLFEPPAREVFTATEFLRTISIELTDDEVSQEKSVKMSDLSTENDEGLHLLLSELNPQFVVMLDGAGQAVNSRNVDRVRHFTVSFRELFTHVIHTLAPDDAVKSWSNDPQHFADSRPTRKARLLYIYRKVNNPSLHSFVDKDINATLELMNVFQSGTHSVELQLNDSQILALKFKMESTLRYMLELS